MLSYKRDRLYLLFFIIHIPVMLLVDLVPLYPVNFTAGALSQLRGWYIKTYKDPFFINPPAWFVFYTWMEALYHIPISVWAIGALTRNSPKIPLHLLIFACQTFMSTMTCLVELLSREDFSMGNKGNLCLLYVPYALLALLMGADMFSRLDTALNNLRSVKRKGL